MRFSSIHVLDLFVTVNWINTWRKSPCSSSSSPPLIEKTNRRSSCQDVWELVFVVRALLFAQTFCSALVSPQEALTLISGRHTHSCYRLLKHTHTHILYILYAEIFQLNTEIQPFKSCGNIRYVKPRRLKHHFSFTCLEVFRGPWCLRSQLKLKNTWNTEGNKNY